MSLTVITPATATRLTTVENVRTDLGLTEAAAPTAKIERLIDQASARASSFCRRRFGRQTVQECFEPSMGRFDRARRGLLLSQVPAISIATVSVDGLLLAPDFYRLVEEPAEPVSLFYLHRVDAGGFCCWLGRNIIVEYVAGWFLPSEGSAVPAGVPALPADIERAVIQLVAASLSEGSRDMMIKSESVEGVGNTSFYVQGASSALPHPGAEAALLPYRRLHLG